MEGLLIANQSRGTDSTGIASINYEGDFEIYKKAENASKFTDHKNIKKVTRSPNPLVIGHTRMTSMGNDVMDQNAHPFLEGKIIGAHNGIIGNYMQLDHTVRVDSQAVLRLLDQHDMAHDWVFGRVSGSCTLTWWDARDPEAMYFVAHRNPLSFAIVDKIDTLFWSSEAGHLASILRASYGDSVKHIPVKQDVIYRFDSSDIWSWQENPVTFASDVSAFGYTDGGVYKSFHYYDDDEDSRDAWESYVSQGVTPKGKAESPVIHDDQDRYEEYWNRIGMGNAPLQSESDDESGGDSGKQPSKVSRTHDLTDMQFQVFDEDGETTCNMCFSALGSGGGIYDAGLNMTLCKSCIEWEDTYQPVSVPTGKYPLVVQ